MWGAWWSYGRITVFGIALRRVTDPHHYNADPNPTFNLHADPGSDPVRDPAPHESDRLSTDPPGLHGVRPRPLQLHFEPLKLLSFDFL